MNSPGCLDGKTLLRFAHTYDEAGGMPVHLQSLNKHLLLRNNMTIVQLFVTIQDYPSNNIVERVGNGILIQVPVLSLKRKISWAIRQKKSKEFMFLRKGISIPGIKRILKVIFHCHLFSIFLRYLDMSDRGSQGKISINEDRREIRKIILRVLNNYNVDLIASHTRDRNWISSLIAIANMRRIPILLQYHSNNADFSTDRVSVFSHKVAGFGGVTDIGVPENLRKKFSPMYNGIDLDFFNPEKCGSNDELIFIKYKKIVLLPARISKIKGHLDLLTITKKLADDGTDFILLCPGYHDDTAFLNELKQIIVEYGFSDRVFFSGNLSQEQLRNMYAKSDVVVLPSKTEGLPRVLLEAQAMKKPVVAYNVGGVSHAFINGETGFLVSPGDSRDFAEKLKVLLLDEAKRKVMGENARKHAEKFGLPALAARHERWYLSAIEVN
jgi:glycosyltransferase involved in cell wall biosynthesis